MRTTQHGLCALCIMYIYLCPSCNMINTSLFPSTTASPLSPHLKVRSRVSSVVYRIYCTPAQQLYVYCSRRGLVWGSRGLPMLASSLKFSATPGFLFSNPRICNNVPTSQPDMRAVDHAHKNRLTVATEGRMTMTINGGLASGDN